MVSYSVIVTDCSFRFHIELCPHAAKDKVRTEPRPRRPSFPEQKVGAGALKLFRT